jgi:hypothetical protein
MLKTFNLKSIKFSKQLRALTVKSVNAFKAGSKVN